MTHTDFVYEHGHEPTEFVPEEMLDESWRGQEVDSSRTSMLDPGLISPGLSLATSSASSRLSAAMR